ncbi:MAG: hypothetical protein ACR2IF_04100 [Terriglobales bacterium]
MRCHEAEAFLAPQMSDAVDGVRQQELASHLASCAACRALLQQEYRLDRLVKAAAEHNVPATENVAAAVRQGIEKETSKRRSPMMFWRRPAFAAVMIAVLAGGLVTWKVTLGNPMHLLCADAADDHRDEVVQAQPRRWRTGPEISEVASRAISASVPANAGGLALTKARICELQGTRALHLVYGDAGKQISVFVMMQSELPRWSVPSSRTRDIHQENDLGMNVASFSTSGFGVVVVGNDGVVRNAAADLLHTM